MFSVVQFFYVMLCKQDLWIRSSTVNWPQNFAHEILARVILRSGVPWGLVKLCSTFLWFFWMRSSIVICTSGLVIWYAFLVPDYGLWSRSSTANLPKTCILASCKSGLERRSSMQKSVGRRAQAHLVRAYGVPCGKQGFNPTRRAFRPPLYIYVHIHTRI